MYPQYDNVVSIVSKRSNVPTIPSVQSRPLAIWRRRAAERLSISDQKRQGFRFKPATISDSMPLPRWPVEGLRQKLAAAALKNPAR